jgi:hypothetical protein
MRGQKVGKFEIGDIEKEGSGLYEMKGGKAKKRRY